VLALLSALLVYLLFFQTLAPQPNLPHLPERTISDSGSKMHGNAKVPKMRNK
jgi:hypothetical protein